MKRLQFLSIAILFYNTVLAQADIAITDTAKSIYKNLPVLKIYVPGYKRETGKVMGSKPNGQPLDQSDQDKYHSTRDAMAQCKPCILMWYDLADHLLSKSIQYTDCAIGYTIDYYLNGNVQLIRSYREKPDGNWNDLRGLCLPDGVFTYFNQNGVRLYNEYWKNGEFIKQVPEQKKTEVWGIDCSLDGQTQQVNMNLTPSQLKRLIFTPKFKNSSREGVNIRIEVDIYNTKHRIKKDYTSDNFNTIDVLKDAKLSSFDQMSGTIYIYNNADYVMNYWVTIKPDK